MSKVEILSPVHVGTGAVVEPVCYKISGNTAERYSLANVVQSMKTENLLDPYVINRLAQAYSKDDYFSLFNNKDYGGTPLYSLQWEIDFNPFKKSSKSQGSNEVFEQVRALNHPMIPGSSLKGAVECAVKYSFLKDHLKQVEKNALDYLEMKAEKRRESTDDLFFLKLVYGVRLINQKKKFYGDFIKALYSCLECRDLSFERMTACLITRYHYSNPKNDMKLGVAEAISPRQKTEADQIIHINPASAKLIEFKQDSICQEVMDWFFTPGQLIRSLQIYGADMIKSESVEGSIDLFEDIAGLNEQIGDLKEGLEKSSETKNVAIVRIGKYATYFYKTVSWLFKKNMNDLYFDFFDDVFSPAPRKKNSPDADSMPMTIPVFNDGQTNWLPGFIRITL